jgi:hypothetical protein
MKKVTECIAGVPQPVMKIPLASTSTLPDPYPLELKSLFERLIIGPSPYHSPMFEAFADRLGIAGVEDPVSKIVRSDIPIRA